MPISQNNKEDIIDRLLVTQRKGQKLVIILKFAGKTKEAKEVGARNLKLSQQIDRLIAKSMRAWNASAATHLGGIKKANADIQKAIRDIKKKIGVARKVVKVTKYLDDVIVIAAKIIASAV